MLSKTSSELSFRPSINQNSCLIANYKHNYSQESLDEKLKRISDTALARKQELQDKLHNEHYDQYKFEPEINTLSRQLARSTNMTSYQDDSRAKKKLRAQASVAELQKICSFSPRINSPKRFSEVSSRYKQGDNIIGAIEKSRQEKQKASESLRKEGEVEELSRCTFKPKSLSKIRSESAIPVKGTDRFHELRSMAKKQQFDQAEREKKLLYRDSTRELCYSPN